MIPSGYALNLHAQAAAAGMQRAKRQKVSEPVPQHTAQASAHVPAQDLAASQPHSIPHAATAALPAADVLPVHPRASSALLQMQAGQSQHAAQPVHHSGLGPLPSSISDTMDAQPSSAAVPVQSLQPAPATDQPAVLQPQKAVHLDSPRPADLSPIMAAAKLTAELDISEPVQSAQVLQRAEQPAGQAAPASAAAPSDPVTAAADALHPSAQMEIPPAPALQAPAAAADAGPHRQSTAVPTAAQPGQRAVEHSAAALVPLQMPAVEAAGGQEEAATNPAAAAAGVSMEHPHNDAPEDAAPAADAEEPAEPAAAAQCAGSEDLDADLLQHPKGAAIEPAHKLGLTAPAAHGNMGAPGSIGTATDAQHSSASQSPAAGSAMQGGANNAIALQSEFMHGDTALGAGNILGSANIPNPFAEASGGNTGLVPALQVNKSPAHDLL